MFPLAHLLRRFVRTGTLQVIDATGRRHVFGGSPDPAVTMRLHSRMLPWRLFFNPELAVGEAYMEGSLTFEDCNVRDLLLLFALNRASLGSYPLQAALRVLWKRMRGLQQYNPIGAAEKNVAHHYDLSRRLYELFLDADLQYSCAYFRNPQDSLEEAQQNKLRLVAAKMLLRPGQNVLEIGCGWGGLALYLARIADVNVTAVTLSQEQYKVACERAQALGLEGRVRFEMRDYRTMVGPFDRVVSVGALEHAGVRHYDEFFGKIRDLLIEDGVALVHAIGKIGPPGTTGPWIRKYIFPGGYTPALSEVFEATQRQKLWTSDVEILRLHYARTLQEWDRRFQAHRAEIASIYDERFCRMWEFYLYACEMAFLYGNQMVFHLQLARKRDATPLRREYIAETEARFMQREQQDVRARLRRAA